MNTLTRDIPQYGGASPSQAAAGTAAGVNASGRLDRLPMTGYQRMLFAIIATAWLFDSIDLGIMTFMLGTIKAEFGLTAAQTGLLASSSFLACSWVRHRPVCWPTNLAAVRCSRSA